MNRTYITLDRTHRYHFNKYGTCFMHMRQKNPSPVSFVGEYASTNYVMGVGYATMSKSDETKKYVQENAKRLKIMTATKA